MKQTYLKEVPVDISNYKNDEAILMQKNNAGQLGFPGKMYTARPNADEQTTEDSHKEEMIMLDIFGALNY